MVAIRPRTPADPLGGHLSARIDTLTSLRFFAAFGVVLYHVAPTMPAVYSGTALEYLSSGVSLFFVLSGYVLGVVYKNRFEPLDYAKRRFARIYPVHLFTLVVWTVLFLHTWPIPTAEKFNSGIAHVLLVHAFFAGLVFSLGFNAPSWSISVEFFFYSLFPAFRKRGALIVVVAGLAVYLTAQFWVAEINAVFPNAFGFFPPLLLWKFAVGVALAQWFEPRRLPFWSATVFELITVGALLVLSLRSFTPIFWQHDILFVIISVAAIAVLSCQGGAVSVVFRLPFLVLLGEASYALYLWHHMLMTKAGPWLAGFPQPERTMLAVSVIVAIIVLSVATFVWFESPLRRYLTR